jgi:uncharacterized protein YceK
MHPYTVKNYLWAVILVTLLVIALAGCSSTPKVQAQKPQYCHTSQTIKTQNGDRVSSETTLDCTDDQTKRLTATRMGMAANCGEFTYWMQIGGRDVQRKGISCQKLDGSWEIVNTGRF